MSQQNLRSSQAMPLKLRLVRLDEPHLAHGSRRLSFIPRPWPMRPAQALDALGHGTRGHQNDLDVALLQTDDLLHPGLNSLTIQAAAIVRHQRATNLDHPPLGSSK